MMHQNWTFTWLVSVAVIVILSIGSCDADCCKTCHPGTSKACGDACISWNSTCHKSAGCACNGTSPSPPPGPSPPSYDHQTKTYKSSFDPKNTSASATITPYFSPDFSVQVLVDFVNAATSTLDIFTPSFASWSRCTSYQSDCQGCSVEKCNNESFPIFPALLNAMNRGVTVRIITNDFGDHTCDDMIAPFDFLVLAGASVRFYTSTTFMHAKFMNRDGKAVSVSSVNWSQTSFVKNREAGMVLEGSEIPEIIEFFQQVFEADWNQGNEYKVEHSYSKDDMAIIQSKDQRPIPDAKNYPMPYISPQPKPSTQSAFIEVFTSPDFAYSTMIDHVKDVKKQFKLYIYQVTDTRLCQLLQDLHKDGIDVKLLVSRYIYGPDDQKAAVECYKNLTSVGLAIQTAYAKTPYTYCHQKFWIVDDKIVSMSTGNWSPSDYPGNSPVFPAYKENPSEWRKVNRDFTVTTSNTDVIDVYGQVFEGDFESGQPWSPSMSMMSPAEMI